MSVVASRYAEAFFSLSLDKNAVEKNKNELNEVKNIFNSVENINSFFISEMISKSQKKEVISNTLADIVNKDTLNFLLLLVDKGRISLYEDIIKSFNHLANNELNIKEGIIESPRPLNKESIKELENALSKNGQSVELKQKINKSLISGFKITIENEIIDASMKEKINKLTLILNGKEG